MVPASCSCCEDEMRKLCSEVSFTQWIGDEKDDKKDDRGALLVRWEEHVTLDGAGKIVSSSPKLGVEIT